MAQNNSQGTASETSIDPADFDQRPARQKPSKYAYIGIAVTAVAAIIIALALIGYGKLKEHYAAKNQAANAQRILDSQIAQEVAILRKRVNEAEAKLKASEAPKPAISVPAQVGFQGWGVVTGTLFSLDQRAEAAARNAKAFDSCLKDDKKLRPCFIEVGNKSHSRFATEFVAVPSAPMTEAAATLLAKCFNANLPRVDSDAKDGTTKEVGAFATNFASKRYAGKTCITPAAE